jgi:CubicO group peptidase (beta-lactamase class C family)
MSRLFTLNSFAAFWFLFVSQSLLAADITETTLSSQIDIIANELLQSTGAPGVSIAVGANNEIVLAKGYGSADFENNVQVTTETRFRTASIAKSLTAVLVLSLEERGVIDLDAPIQTYLPDFPEKQWPITSRLLLGHLAGIRHYDSNSESQSTQQFDSVQEGLKVFADDPLKHRPGSKFLYSSFGYNLLGAVAEQAGERSFMEQLHRHVLEPAGMNHTVEDSHADIISSRTRGYVKIISDSKSLNSNENSNCRVSIQNAPMHNTSMKIPAGGLLSTPSDLVKFSIAVNTGKLLDPETCKKMWNRQIQLDGTKTSCGLGWNISQHTGRKMVSHSGGQAGTSTLLVLFPDSGTSVAIMCNLQNVALKATAKQLASIVLPQEKEPSDDTVNSNSDSDTGSIQRVGPIEPPEEQCADAKSVASPQSGKIQNVAFETVTDTDSKNIEEDFEYSTTASGPLPLADGFYGIWYMNQPSKDEYVYKYSGGMATYPWQHHPIAIYSPQADKTFFVYGGRYRTRNTLLHCVSFFDHTTGLVARPRVLLDKKTDDAHDNPVLCIDEKGHLLIFSSAHGTSRPAYIHRSIRPYDIDEFDCIATTNFSYPQPWSLGDQGLLLLHTRYKGGRVLHAMNSPDGVDWSEPRALAHVGEGHYQVSQVRGSRIATAFNFHPKGKGLNHRTNVYYLESSDAGQTWSNVQGQKLSLPITQVDNPALVMDAASEGRLCYMRCVRFALEGQPVILFVTSAGYQSGPQNDPRQFVTARWTGSEWEIRQAMKCDNNYDFADLEIRDDGVWQISGVTENGPQKYNTGGEIAIWHSKDEGASWQLAKQLTTKSKYNHNFPRKPLNAHPDFYLLWADGHARQPSDSCLYFTDRDGSAIWKLPSEIKGDQRTIQPIRFEVGDELR